ncbi:MAG: OmpA family protein [Desulfatitalea sp.]|nr:OmpA family protein [Desulfatitalea sp.]
MDREIATNLARRIEWKNTLDNYAYFGLQAEPQGGSRIHIEEMITNIVDVLVKTGTLPAALLQHKTHTLYHDRILAELRQADFHPGKKVDLVEGLGAGTSQLAPRHHQARLAPLTDAQWQGLVPVGSLRIAPIAFGRGTARINLQSSRDLEALVRRLEGWPHYYLRVVGHTRDAGDRDANLKLARERAEAAVAALLAAGLDPNRVRAEAALPKGDRGEAQSVSFILGQSPF